jgi:hypothetical protein
VKSNSEAADAAIDAGDDEALGIIMKTVAGVRPTHKKLDRTEQYYKDEEENKECPKD